MLRRLRSQGELTYEIRNPPTSHDRPYRQWFGDGFEAAVGALLPLWEAGGDWQAEVGFRAADFGMDHIPLGRYFAPVPNVVAGTTWTLLLGLRWNA